MDIELSHINRIHSSALFCDIQEIASEKVLSMTISTPLDIPIPLQIMLTMYYSCRDD